MAKTFFYNLRHSLSYRAVVIALLFGLQAYFTGLPESLREEHNGTVLFRYDRSVLVLESLNALILLVLIIGTLIFQWKRIYKFFKSFFAMLHISVWALGLSAALIVTLVGSYKQTRAVVRIDSQQALFSERDLLLSFPAVSRMELVTIEETRNKGQNFILSLIDLYRHRARETYVEHRLILVAVNKDGSTASYDFGSDSGQKNRPVWSMETRALPDLLRFAETSGVPVTTRTESKRF